jgi:hypothetical protein
MITRRNLIIRLQASLAALLAGQFGLTPNASARVESGPRGIRENCSFLMDVRSTLARRVERGELSIIAETSVRCPLCKETITVTAKEALAYVASDMPVSS